MAYVDLKSKLFSDLDTELDPDFSKERIIILNKEGETTTANTVLVEDFHANTRPGYKHLETGVLLLSNGNYRGTIWASNHMGEGIDGGEPYFKKKAVEWVTQSNGSKWKGFNGMIVVEDLVPDNARAVYVTVGNTSGGIGGWFRFWSYNEGYHDHRCYSNTWTSSDAFLNVHTTAHATRDAPWSVPIISIWDEEQKKHIRSIRILIDNHNTSNAFSLWLRGYWV